MKGQRPPAPAIPQRHTRRRPLCEITPPCIFPPRIARAHVIIIGGITPLAVGVPHQLRCHPYFTICVLSTRRFLTLKNIRVTAACTPPPKKKKKSGSHPAKSVLKGEGGVGLHPSRRLPPHQRAAVLQGAKRGGGGVSKHPW